jgi:threonine/homoserine/homoserine lactone efflux protein
MTAHTALVAILGALLIGAISPGSSFVLVSRIAITQSRLQGLAAAIGMGLGGTVFAALALLGLAALLNRIEGLYIVLKLVGGIYLGWLGIRIWRGAREPLASMDVAIPRGRSLLRAFSFAVLTQLSNPKTAIVYGSIFASMLPASPPSWLLAVLPPLVFTVETAWYAVVALAFSAQHPRALYLRDKVWVDRLAGTVMGLLGVRLIVDAFSARRL